MKRCDELIVFDDVDEMDTQVTCQHRPGKFLGHCFSPNYERHECSICGEEIKVRVNR